MISKKKVLFVLHLPPPVHGAAMVGRYIQESKRINQSFEADFINLSTSVEMSEIGKGGTGKLKNLLNIQRKVIAALLHKKYDLVYVTLTSKGSGFYKDVLVVALLKLFRKNIIYHFHNKGVTTRQHHMLDHRLYRFVFRHTKSILLSPYLFYDIKRYVKPEDVFYCANGIPHMADFSEQKNTAPDSTCRLLFLSNMVVEKGVFVLLEACKLLHEKGLPFECHFVGAWSDISEANFTEKVAQAGLQQKVFAHGKRYGDEKLRFFQEADVFVLPTFNEAFPLVILEAMQAGLPVVATPEGGIPEMVADGETGFLVPTKEAAALAAKLELLVQNPEWRGQMGAAAKKKFHERYTVEKFEQNLAAILANAAAVEA